jgi:hypothetical protein
MLNFRKVLLAASVASLVLVGSASAQVYQGGQVAVIGGAPGYAFIEATTQLVPNISIQIAPPAGGTAPAAGTPVSFLISSNVAITNVLAAGSTTNLDIAVYTSTNASACAAATDTASAVVATSSPTQIQVTFNSITVPSTTVAPAYICVDNLRVNSSQVGSTSVITVSPAGIAGGNFVPSTSTTTNTATVAYASKSLGTVTTQSVGNAGGAVADANGISTSICNIVPSTTTSTTKTSGFGVANLTFATTPQALLPATGLSGAAVVAGNAPVAATQGVRLAITFNNLIAGVNYYVGAAVSTVVGPSFSYYSAAAGGSVLSVAGSPTTLPDNVATAYQLTPTGSSATIYLGVTANSAPASANTITIPVYANIPSNAGVQAFTTSQITASITLVGVASGYPQYSSAQTAYTSSAVTTAGGLITSCSTTLLFPYVVNNSGFDTAMVITNASTGTGVAAGSGLCTVNFYGTGTSATTLPITYAPTQTLSAVTATAGTTNNLSFTASGQAPGISGYAVASCNFVGAHGYAFLFSGAGTPAAYAADYLAVVLQSGAAVLTPTF